MKKKLELKKSLISVLSDVEQRQMLDADQMRTEDPCLSAAICSTPVLCDSADCSSGPECPVLTGA